MSAFPYPIFGAPQQLIIPPPDTSLLIPHSPNSIDTSLLFPPLSPSSDTSNSSSGCTSPVLSSDNEELELPMDQISNVKKLLRMFPPPMTAEEFIFKNSFKASDGHIKRPSNNFILFRKIAHDQKNQTPALSDHNERQFSQIIGKIWKDLTHEERSTYKRLGKEVADLHKKLHPNYKYQPKRDKAAWKHFNPEMNNSNQKSKRKNNKAKQQKDQETTSDIPKINLNIPQQQQQQQQQQPIVSDSDLDQYTLGLDQMDQMYFPTPYTTNNAYATNNTYAANNTYTANNTFTTSNPIIDLFNVNDDYGQMYY